MFSPMLPRTLLLHRFTVLLRPATRAVLLLVLFTPAHSQSTASIEGQVVDQHGAVIANAQITIHNRLTGTDRIASSDEAGRYQVAALPVGEYRIEVKSPGFQTQIVDRLTVEVARRITQNFQLLAGDVSELVTVTSSNGIIEASTISFGHVVNQRMVQEIPLNGRYFLDLGLLVAGSVTPPQTGSGSIPVRGTGSFAFNTAGNREESVNYMINGISLNDPAFTSINFQPFGNLGRNVVIGPRFDNVDFSIIKNTKIGERVRIQFRAEIFDLFNHANFGQPGNLVGAPTFGTITNTRFPTGESGSSRQVQFGLKLMF